MEKFEEEHNIGVSASKEDYNYCIFIAQLTKKYQHFVKARCVVGCFQLYLSLITKEHCVAHLPGFHASG